MRIAINAVVLYAAWFAAVLSAAAGDSYGAAAASLCAITINLALAPDKSSEIRLIVIAALTGLAVDGTLVSAGLTHYASPGPYLHLPPAWIILMWMAFATTLNVSLGWLQRRLTLASLLGLIAGPTSYYAGARLGGMHISDPVWLSLVAVGVLWSLALPLLLRFARHSPH